MVEKLRMKEIYVKNRKAIRNAFWKDGALPSVQLSGFLPKAASLVLRREIAKLSFSRDDDPLTHRYAAAPLPPTLRALFSSRNFLEFVSFIIRKKVEGVEARMLRFCAGDYALRHGNEEKKAPELGFDIVFDVDGLASPVGGSVVFVDEGGSYHAIAPSQDALTIVKRKRGVQRFVQYHNHYAEDHHLVLGTLRIDAGVKNTSPVAKQRSKVGA